MGLGEIQWVKSRWTAGTCFPQVSPFLAITAEIYSKGSIRRVMQTGIREGPTKSLVPPPLWNPDAASLVLVPFTAATHTTGVCGKSCPRVKERWRDEQDRADFWMDKHFTWLPLSSPCCLSWGRAVARARMSFPSCQPNSPPILLVSIYFPEKPLSKTCVVEVKSQPRLLSSRGRGG